MSKFFNPRATKADFVMLFVGIAVMVGFAVASFVFFVTGSQNNGWFMLVPAATFAFVNARGWKYMVKR